MTVNVAEGRNRAVIIHPNGEIVDVDWNLLFQRHVLILAPGLDRRGDLLRGPALVLLKYSQRKLVRILHPHAAMALGAYGLRE